MNHETIEESDPIFLDIIDITRRASPAVAASIVGGVFSMLPLLPLSPIERDCLMNIVIQKSKEALTRKDEVALLLCFCRWPRTLINCDVLSFASRYVECGDKAMEAWASAVVVNGKNTVE